MTSKLDKRRRAAGAKVGKAAGKGAGRAAKGGAKTWTVAGKGAGRAAKKGAETWTAVKAVERAALPERRRTKGVLLIAAGGALVAVLVIGRRQRRERAAALLRRGRDEAARKADYAAGHVKGAAHGTKDRVTPDAPKAELTDQDLARKVETIIFRDASVPKGKINVDAAGRTVSLRGEADSQEMIDDLARQTHAIPEVEVVEVFLHLPGEPAATRSNGSGS